ncbi:Protein CBG06752 [Caenorhabditis briggsae]|uniref:Protein CBG06752 n=4 Tax=Caenorhabditis briggsae TaxID=6238 RepID=A8X302_CAEBR|nr:Protein CBG06752 [Caenorhabditis briggsae]ULT88346.1 hypothetical protein L3Y34_007501 [Caenorhabditis briggsae]CAP27012.2 Protein CBG06752 [Caenorhabditis briggsae]
MGRVLFFCELSFFINFFPFQLLLLFYPSMVALPNALSDAETNTVEFCRNLLTASHNKPCHSSAELLRKVMALSCIQESVVRQLASALQAVGSVAVQAGEGTSSSSSNSPLSIYEEFLYPLLGVCSSMTSTSSTFMPAEEPEPGLSTSNDTPVFFNSLTSVLNNLHKTGVDPIVAESIAVDRIASPCANPKSLTHKCLRNGIQVLPVDEPTSNFMKHILRKLHNYEKFVDGAPYDFDAKSVLRYSEYLHSQIPSLETISPPHLAHEMSITIAAMARCMAMHEQNFELQIIYPTTSHLLEEPLFYSAIFWSYREAFKSYYYQQMPAPLPSPFQMTAEERHILCRYWNAGNRHVSAKECILLAKALPRLQPFQIYGFFDKRRRREYNRYRGLKDEETLALETIQVWKKLKSIKQNSDEDDSDNEDEALIARDLTKHDRDKLDLLWKAGHRKPSRNECELIAAEAGISSGEQIYAYFEDKRWREEYDNRKQQRASTSRT